MARTKSATEVKIDFLVREVKELKIESKSLRADINKGKGAIWILVALASVIASVFNYFSK
jgi:ribosomal silencing factor RsfS